MSIHPSCALPIAIPRCAIPVCVCVCVCVCARACLFVRDGMRTLRDCSLPLLYSTSPLCPRPPPISLSLPLYQTQRGARTHGAALTHELAECPAPQMAYAEEEEKGKRSNTISSSKVKRVRGAESIGGKMTHELAQLPQSAQSLSHEPASEQGSG